MISIRDFYASLTQLVIHTESISWNRFSNFLLYNSFLILAWATIFVSSKSSTCEGRIILLLICLIGGLSGIAWADLGKRGRRYLRRYFETASSIEKTPFYLDQKITDEFLPFQITEKAKCYSSSDFLVSKGPYFLSFLYLLLIIASFL